MTPSAGVISIVRDRLHVPLFVMIRPRPGNFVYTAPELAAMKHDIAFCRKHRIDGVVLGILDEHRNIDLPRTAELVELARPMEVTFHRAFDLTPDATQALEDVISSGCSRLLTSGQAATAAAGAALLQQLAAAAGNRLRVVPAAGVRSTNLHALASQTGAREFHSSARRPHTASLADTLAFGEEINVDESEVRALRAAADES